MVERTATLTVIDEYGEITDVQVPATVHADVVRRSASRPEISVGYVPTGRESWVRTAYDKGEGTMRGHTAKYVVADERADYQCATSLRPDPSCPICHGAGRYADGDALAGVQWREVCDCLAPERTEK